MPPQLRESLAQPRQLFPKLDQAKTREDFVDLVDAVVHRREGRGTEFRIELPGA